MLRLVYVVLVSLPLVIYYIFRSRYVANHAERYTELERYTIAQRIIRIMKRNGRITTDVYGTENLPETGGYVMYSNHQGKYDALGIIAAHKKPCTFVIDDARSRIPLAKEFTMLLNATRLDKTNPKAQVKTILDVIKQVKEGRRYIIFPEGGYESNKNDLQEFLPGTFKCSVRSKTPIIPVAIKDSYKVFGINSIRRIRTEVHFLKPLYYEEYANLNTIQIAQIVKDRIYDAIHGEGSLIAQTNEA